MSKAVGSLSFEMNVDDSKFTPKLNTMKQEVRNLSQTMKANASAAKEAGDSLGAYEARMTGLQQVVEKQKAVQESLERSLKATGARTDQNANAWDKAKTELDKATATYKNFSSQLDSATTRYERAATGIDALNKSVEQDKKLMDAVSESYKKSNDKMGEAKAKVDALTSQQDKLNLVREKEKLVLQDVIDKYGKESEQYVKQATALQNATNRAEENSAAIKKNTDYINSNKDALSKMQAQSKLVLDTNKAYADAQESLGKKNQANIDRLSAYKNAMGGLSNEYKLQLDDLKLMQQSGGNTALQIDKQKLAVAEAAKAYGDMHKNVVDTQKEVNKSNPFGITKFSGAANDAFRASQKMSDGFSSAFTNIKNKSAGVALGIAGVVGIVGHGVKQMADLQDTYLKTNNMLVTGGEKQSEVTKNITQMQKDGREMSIEYGKSQQEIAEGYLDLTKRGYTSKAALGAMRTELQASVSTGDDFNSVVSVSSQVLDSYNLRVDDATQMQKNTKEVVNQLSYAADMTATDFHSMGKAMEYVGDTASAAQIPLSQASTSIGILSNHGLEADKAGTGLRKVINSLTQALGDQISAQDKSAEGQAKLNEKVEEQKQKVQEAQDAVNKATEAEKNSTKGKKGFTKQVESSNKELKKQQDNLDKLEGKAQAAAGAQDMLSSLGISRDQLVQSNGQLKSMSDIMKILNDKTKGIKDVDVKNNIFHALFGTTGMQAGIILAQNNQELGELTDKVKKSADGQGYVATLAEKNMQSTKQQMKQLNSVAQDITMSFGAAVLPAVNKAATEIRKGFDSDGGQKFLKGTSDWIGKIAMGLVDVATFIGEHRSTFKSFAELMIGIFAVNKVGQFVGALKNTIDIFKQMTKAAMEFKAVDALSGGVGGVGGIGGKAGKAAGVAGEAEELGMSAIGSRAAGAGGAYVKGAGKLGTAMNVTKGVAGVAAKYAGIFGAAFTAVDLGGSVVKALSSNDAQAKYKAGAQTAGTTIGGTIGGILGTVIPGAGTVIGAGLGATIGNELGKTGWAQKAAEDAAKLFNDTFNKKGVKINPDTVTQKGALKDLSDAYKKYYTDKAKADQADIDLLHKNGLMSDAEYQKRTDEIKKEGDKANNFEKMSQEDRTNITKYYQEQRKDLENTFSKEKKKISDKWDNQYAKDLQTYGANSIQVKTDLKKKEQALEEVDAKRKKEINKLTIENVTKTTADEARLHETAAGKIELAQRKLLTDHANFNKNSKKLSAAQLKSVEKDAKDQYDTVKYYADKTFNETKKAADKKYDEVTKAADNEFKNVKKSAEEQRDATIAAGNKQYSGTSKAAQDQRKAVTDAANQQYADTVKKASDQHQSVYDSADKQHQDVVGAAQKQHDETVKKAEDQKNEITKKAEEQKTNIVKKSDETHTAVKKGSDDFWTQFIGGIGNALGLNAKKINSAIGGINWVLHSFGAGKETIKPLQEKYASGTGFLGNARRPINKPTFALLNDGNDSPETGNREALVHPNGNMEIVEGRNVSRLLAPGTEVINAKELAMLMSNQTPFADGTGWLSSLWDGAKSVGSWVGKVAGDTWSSMSNGVEKFTKMFKYITNAVAHPVETLSEQFTQKRDSDRGAVFNTIMDGTHKMVKDQGKDWWTTLWGMANNAASTGDTDGQGDNYPWKNSGKDSGADPWGYFLRECVSYVANSLKNMGVPTSLFSGLGNGADWVNAKVPHTNNPRPGMVAVYGPGSEFGNHVAMVRGVKGNTFSGEEYNWGGDGRYHTFSGRQKSGATTFLDFGKSGGDEKSIEANGPLEKLIKGQVGGMFDWIQKFIGPVNDTSTGVGGDVQSWSNDVKKALEKLGLSDNASMVQKVLRQIQTESGGNPRAIGGNDGLADGNATGLMQVKPGTFAAYALSGHNNIMNGYDNLLAGLNYAKDRYGRDLGFLGNGHGYANGGRIDKHQIAQIGEGDKPEYIIPMDKLKRSRALSLTRRLLGEMSDDTEPDSSSMNSNNSEILSMMQKQVDLLTQLVASSLNPTPAYVVANQAKTEIDKVQAMKNSLDLLARG